MLEHDFAVYGPDGHLDLVVEARASLRPSMGWAVAFRHNLLESGRAPRGAWFLVATPTALYLWKPDDGPDEVPVAQEAAEQVFAPYRTRAGVGPTERVDPLVFDSIVQSWLGDLARNDGRPGDRAADQQPVTHRLESLLRGARVTPARAA